MYPSASSSVFFFPQNRCAVRRGVVFAVASLAVPALSPPAYAQKVKKGKEEKGSYVSIEGNVQALGGVSDRLYLQGNILGGLESNGAYSTRPTQFWIKNTGAHSCFISGEQTGFSVGSAGKEIKPQQTLRSGLATYRSKGRPITSIHITLKAWIPASPPPPKLALLRARKLGDLQTMFESSMQRYEAMKDQLQAGDAAWEQIPEAQRDAALPQQLDGLAAKQQEAIDRMGRFMDGYKRGDLSDLDAVLTDLDKINTELQGKAQWLKPPTLQKPQELAPVDSGDSTLFRSLLNRDHMITFFDRGTPTIRITTRLDLLPGPLLRFTLKNGAKTGQVDIPLDAIDPQALNVHNNLLDRNVNPRNYCDGYELRFILSRKIGGLDDFRPGVQAPGISNKQLQLSILSFLKEELGTVAPLPDVKPAVDSRPVQALQTALASVTQEASTLPKQAESVSVLDMVKPAVQKQYISVMNGLESKSLATVSRSLAPDYTYEDLEGKTLALAEWKTAQEEMFKKLLNLHMVVRVETQEQDGDELVVTATRTFIDPTDISVGTRLEQKVRERWTQTAGQYRLQSTNVLQETSTDPEEIVRRGNTYYAAKKYKEMEALYREALRLRPDTAKFHRELGAALAWQGKMVDAEAEYREAVRLEPEVDLYQYSLGIALDSLKKYSEAETAFRSAVRLNPADPDYRRSLAKTLSWQSKWGGAEEQYREAIRLDPKDAEDYANLAGMIQYQNRPDEARKFARQAIALGLKEHWVYKELGLIP